MGKKEPGGWAPRRGQTGSIPGALGLGRAVGGFRRIDAVRRQQAVDVELRSCMHLPSRLWEDGEDS